jgi:hypothetical protein
MGWGSNSSEPTRDWNITDMGPDTEGWNLHSPDLKLILSQVSNVWADGDAERDEMWSVDDSRITSNASRFAMDGSFVRDVSLGLSLLPPRSQVV